MSYKSKCLLGQEFRGKTKDVAPCKNAGVDGICNEFCGSFIAIKGRLADASVPKKYHTLNLLNSAVRAEQEVNYQFFDKYVAQFGTKEIGDIKNLYLHSYNSGTGKTTSATAILSEFVARTFIADIRKGISPSLFPIFYFDVNEWQNLYNQFNRSGTPTHIKEEASDKYYSIMEKVKKADMVLFDDVGVRDATVGFRSDLHSVVQFRLDSEDTKIQIYTSNHSIAELEGVFGEKRLMDRIKDRTIEIGFDGESHRTVKRER